MNSVFIQPQQWLYLHHSLKHQLLLVIDTVSAPGIIAKLFQLAPVREYIGLFQGTEFEEPLEYSPWLVRVETIAVSILAHLLQCLARNWAWIASAAHFNRVKQAFTAVTSRNAQ